MAVNVRKDVLRGRSNRQPVRWNIIMFEVQGDDENMRADQIVARNLSEEQAEATMFRLERRNPRMGYGALSVKRRH